MSDINRRYPNLRLSGTPDRLGRVQKQIRRAFSSGGKPLGISALLRWCYPRASKFKPWHRTNVHRAVAKVAKPIRRHRRGNEWVPFDPRHPGVIENSRGAECVLHTLSARNPRR